MILTERRSVAAKKHQCYSCGATITPGTRYCYTAGIGDDGFYTYKECEPCDALRPIVWDFYDRPYEGVGEDDYIEWAREHEHLTAEHGYMARAFLARKQAAHDAWVARMDSSHGKGNW